MSKNIYGYILLAIAAIAATHYFFFYKPCTNPTVSEQMVIQLRCVSQLFTMSDVVLRAGICDILERDKDCDIYPEDGYAIEEYFRQVRLSCMKKLYRQQNFCTKDIKLLGRR